MSLFDSASLVVTPNGVKAGKLYSIKPTDGSGDLSVTRATSATRVDANGLIEIPRTNLTQRSEDFDNGYWVKTNSDITSNTAIAPDGNLTADTFSDRVLLTNQTYPIARNQSYTSGTAYTSSFFAKNLDRRYVYMRFVSAVFGTNKYVFFDLQLGTIISVSSGVTAEIIDYGNGWYRCIATSTASVTTSTVNGVFIGLSDNGVNVAYTNPSVKSIYLWGAQLEVGNSATEYIPTTSSSIRTKFAGITQDGASASNIPRLDYTNGSCPSILVEPQRTNLVLRSEEFDNIIWSLGLSATISANTTISPDGTQNADTLTLINAATSRIQQTISATSSTYTVSIYAKSSVSKKFRFRIITSGTSQISNDFTTSNIWQRYSFTFTSDILRIEIINESLAVAGSLDIWGAQLEAGANATSYIPTTSATVTRNADVISKTGISDLIGQTEGTVLCDINLTKLSESKALFVIDNGTTNEYINLIRVSTNIFRLSIKKTGTSAVNIINSAVINDSRCRIAIAYKNGDYAMYVNGVQKGTSTNSTNYPTTALTQFVLSNASYGYLNDSFNASAIWKTRLTNAELETLTTI